MSIARTAEWFKLAVPEPTQKNINTQLGVHFEEVGEMVNQLISSDPDLQQVLAQTEFQLDILATALKTTKSRVSLLNRTETLDAILDQIVTATGVAHMFNMNAVQGLDEVNHSNFSKFDENGKPIFNENMKIIKGLRYFKPILTSFV